jgi:hypothetical protein
MNNLGEFEEFETQDREFAEQVASYLEGFETGEGWPSRPNCNYIPGGPFTDRACKMSLLKHSAWHIGFRNGYRKALRALGMST